MVGVLDIAANTAAGSEPLTNVQEISKPIKKQRNWRFYAGKIIQLYIGSIIAAIGLEIFLVPNDVIDGGVVGIAIMLAELTDIPMGVFLVLVNLPFLYLGYKQIGKGFAISTTFAVISLSLWTAYFKPIPGLTQDLFLATVFGGIIDGIGVGLIMRAGGSLDGTEIVAIIAEKKSPYSVGEIIMFMNIFILGASAFVFGVDKAMYSLVAYQIISRTIDSVLKGFNDSYSVTIISNHPDEIADYIMNTVGRGVTFYSGIGAYTGQPKKIIKCIVTRLEIQSVKDAIHDIDEKAFVSINTVQEIIGGRFKKHSV